MIQDAGMLATSKLTIAPDWQNRLHARSLDRFDALWQLPGHAVKTGRSTEVTRTEIDDRTVFIKKHRATGLNQLLSAITRGALFGTSKVRREFENLRQLRQWGLDAPAPVAIGEHRVAGWLVRSLLVSEAVVEPVPLDQFIVENFSPHLHPLPASGERRLPVPLSLLKGEGQGEGSIRRNLIDRLADYVSKLHGHRFVHHDLYWRNIILTKNSLDHFYLIDAHKGRVWRDEPTGRAQDLATLDAPAPAYFRRTERLRFLLRYLGKPKLDTDAKALARLALELAGPMRDRQLARVREARQ